MDKNKLLELAEALADAKSLVEETKKKAEEFRVKHQDAVRAMDIAKDNLDKFMGLK